MCFNVPHIVTKFVFMFGIIESVFFSHGVRAVSLVWPKTWLTPSQSQLTYELQIGLVCNVAKGGKRSGCQEEDARMWVAVTGKNGTFLDFSKRTAF